MARRERRVSRGKVISRTKYQVGSTVRRYDVRKRAVGAGLRKTKNPHYYHGRLIRKSTTYYENRRNRSDVHPAFNGL